jgi:hypothetical protein
LDSKKFLVKLVKEYSIFSFIRTGGEWEGGVQGDYVPENFDKKLYRAVPWLSG